MRQVEGPSITKLMTREPRDYQKAGITAIAARQLFGSGVKLRPGQNIEYVITNSEAHVPNDRVRAYALWEGWFGYDRKKYASMLREAFEPFVLRVRKRANPFSLSDSISEIELKRFPFNLSVQARQRHLSCYQNSEDLPEPKPYYGSLLLLTLGQCEAYALRNSRSAPTI